MICKHCSVRIYENPDGWKDPSGSLNGWRDWVRPHVHEPGEDALIKMVRGLSG